MATDDAVKRAKVLMVGAGGIGCELLKTLVLSGFENIEMIDMDTIETSNLNRQFLFRRRHVGQSKAEVARAAVLRFRPQATVVAHHDNVKNPAFDTNFFARFDCVLNGLDNMDARRHVNRMCLAAGVPLVESGTEGYLGQVSVHMKGVTECFECTPKAAPKTYAVCTIRNTPDKPIHCVVWAKDLLFNTLFGPRGASDLEEAPAPAAEDDEEGGARETAEEAAERATFFRMREAEDAAAFAHRIYARAYGADIERLLRMKDLWEKPGRKAPSPLPPPSPAVAAMLAAAPAGESACASLGLTDAHAMWSPDQTAAVFLLSAARLGARLAAAPDSPLSFDKDDALAVEFVAAAAALRGLNYGIPGQSLFHAKGMAGRIIHAIATTNAIIAGLIVIEATKLIKQHQSRLKCTFLTQFPVGRGLLLSAGRPEPPAAGCYVCRRARLHLHLDPGAWTLGQLVDEIIGPKLSVSAPTVSRGDTLLHEAGADLDDDERAHYTALRARLLPDLPGGGLRDGMLFSVDDDSAGAFSVEIKIVARPRAEADTARTFELLGDVPVAVEAAAAAPEAAMEAADDADSIVLVEDAPDKAAVGKRKRDDDGAGPAEPRKKVPKSGDAGDAIDQSHEL